MEVTNVYQILRERGLVLYKQKKIPKLLMTSSAIALIMLLNGCGDQNRSTKDVRSMSHKAAETKPVVMKFNTPPTAHAGADQIVRVGEIVTLNGTQSADPDHDLMTFNWTQSSGPAVEIVNADTLTPSFVAPASKQPLSFALVVSDGKSDAEASVSVTISNRAPLANAGRTIIAKRGSKVMLDGSASVDPDKDNLVYKWTQVHGEKVALKDTTKISPFFTMPNSSGYLIFALTVNDGTDESVADTVAVKVTNTAPVAKIAAIHDNVIGGKKIQLDGSASSDADGDTLAYNWSQTLGTPVMLEGANSATPRFNAPQRPDHLVFELTVNDGEKTSHPESVIVSVKNEVKPFEVVPDINKIVKMKEAAGLTAVKKEKATLEVATAPAPVENFLPEIAKSFVAPAAAAMDTHGKPAHGKANAKHGGDHKKAHWSYEGDGGPEHWATLDNKFELCGSGKQQSPIDIQTAGMKLHPQPIEFHYGTSAINVINNGHTIQANYDKGSYAMIGGKRYDLLQFHFHSPSEHTIDSKPADMVAHMVHKAKDGELAVVGVLFKKGKENEFLKQIWSNLPLESGMKTESAKTIFAANMLPEMKSFYHYTGSLTTPPCSEGVNWNVMTTMVEASAAQVDAFRSIFSKSVRPTQPLNGRVVSMQ